MDQRYLASIELQRDLVPSFEAHPYALPAIRGLSSIDVHSKVIFLVGENGSGKSTLLEAVAVKWGFNAEGGSRSFGFSTRNSHSDLHKYLKLVRSTRQPRDGYFFRAESFFNVATEIEKIDEETKTSTSTPIIASYGGKSLHEQSHGEAFMTLVLDRFHGNGFYLLDEPEAALSPTRQLALLTRIHDLVTDDSQFVIATHSPILLAYPDARILSFEEEGIREVAYEDTEHYTVTRSFLLNHRRMLSTLLE
jgi:predicted ATPase